jgi:hypothetical protein
MEFKENDTNHAKGFTLFAIKKIVVTVFISVAVLWALVATMAYVNLSSTDDAAEDLHESKTAAQHIPDVQHTPDIQNGPTDKKHVENSYTVDHQPKHQDTVKSGHDKSQPVENSHDKTASEPVEDEIQRVPGYAFVTATIKPLEYELEERAWGWRSNDLVRITDNINDFQVGVLEVTQKTVDKLSDSISRIGSSAAFNTDLELARRTCFAIKADRIIPPTPEARYKAGIKKLRTYRDKLEKGEAAFYTRTDSLIPLLMEYESLLGSCDDNLVKQIEDDGKPVSFFKVDHYFYNAKGVSSAMATILEAVHKDFHSVLENRYGTESLHYAIESLHHASELEPLIILDSDLDGLMANHRANMAAHISHARFYLGILIKTLST